MNVIIGMTQLLIDSPVSPEQKEQLEDIDQAARSLLGIVNDILDLSKIEAGKLDLNQSPFNFRTLIDEVLSLLKYKFEEKQLRVISEVSDRAPMLVLGDETRVRQVLINLLGNSIKFTPEAGSIKIKVSPFQSNEYKVFLLFEIIDSGIGIPENQLADIFEPFTQADGGVTRRFGGTGLGLTITRQLVEMMGGSIAVHSEPNVGSTFSFTLPLIETSNEANTPSVSTKRRYGRLFSEARTPTVLVVEDSPVNKRLAQQFLERFGCKVVEASDGLEAVELFKKHHNLIELILMDCQMPVQSGYEATIAIRELERELKLHTPIVAMTANAMKGDREICIDAGMDDYISKPIDIDRFAEILVQYIRL